MWHRDVQIGRRRVIITLGDDPVVSGNGGHFFGYPVAENLTDVTASTIGEDVLSIAGYFLYVNISRERVVIATDITGGFRTYTCTVDDTTYISDDYRPMLAKIKQAGQITIDESELAYWRKHRYTTGDRTFVKGLHKLAPASVMEITPDHVSHDCYFPDIGNQPNAPLHTLTCQADVRTTLQKIGESGSTIALLFSGGTDSTALAVTLRELGVPFVPVFFRSRPYFDANYHDFNRSLKISDQLGLSLEVLDVDLDHVAEQGRFVEPMLFDRHFSLLHFDGMRQLADLVGTDAIVLCGQGSDSVLSYGPSQRSKGDLAARVLLHSDCSVLTALAGMAVQRAYGKRLTRPQGKEAVLSAFFNSYGYFPVADSDDPQHLQDYVTQTVRRLASRFTSFEAARMYIKIFGFMQGSDNQIVIQSARAAGIKKVLLPFVSPGFINGTVAHRSGRYEIFRPKYAVADLVRRQHIKVPAAGNEELPPDTVELDEITASVDELFEAHIDRLTSQVETTGARQ